MPARVLSLGLLALSAILFSFAAQAAPAVADPTLADAGSSAVAAMAAPAEDADAPDAGKPLDDGSGIASLPAAAPISFKAGLEKAEVTLGEPFALTIEVKHTAKETYSLPAHLDLHDFGMRDHQIETHGEDPLITVVRLSLQAFETGERTIPAIHLSVDTPDGARQLELPAQKVKVTGVIDDSQGAPQMKEDLKPLPTRYRWVLWPLWLVAAVVLGVVAALWFRRRQLQPAFVPPPPPRMAPYEEALARLKALEDENLVGKGQKQPYYFRLSEIVRDFFGRRYEFESLEMTSNELLSALRQRSTPGLDYDGLEQFLNDSDLVKFAKRDPSDGESKMSLEAVRKLVQRARPQPQPFEGERRPA